MPSGHLIYCLCEKLNDAMHIFDMGINKRKNGKKKIVRGFDEKPSFTTLFVKLIFHVCLTNKWMAFVFDHLNLDISHG